jgi:hypothetical protein
MAQKNYRPSTSKLIRTSFALDHRWVEMTKKLRAEHQVPSVTDYIKGLIAADWLNNGFGPLDLRDVPVWIIPAFEFEVREGKVIPPVERSKLKTIG